MREVDLVAYLKEDETLQAEFIPVDFNIPPVLTTKTITENGIYNAESDNASGYSSVTVVVPPTPANIHELNVTPTTEPQTISVPSNIDGYGPINVGAVTSSIDSNIQSENIKSGVSILGVNGSVAELNGSTTTINPSTSTQTVMPTAPNNAFTEVTVPAVTSEIDSNIRPENIREGIDILGTTGTAHIPNHYVDFDSTNGALTKKAKMINLDGITSIASNALLHEYNSCVFENGTLIDMSGITHIGANGCASTFYNTTGITSVDMSGLVNASTQRCCQAMFSTSLIASINLSKLKTITGNYAFYQAAQASYLRDIDLSSLEIINAQYGCSTMFKSCTLFTNINLSALKEIWDNYACQSMFAGCIALTSANLESVVLIGGARAAESMFLSCSTLTDVKMSSLKQILLSNACQNMFQNCTQLRTLKYPALRSDGFGTSVNQFSGMLSGTTGCTVHFPKNLDPQSGSTTISSLSGYPTFGSTSTVLEFDLPSTFILTGANTSEYERNPKYDTETAVAWRIKDTSSSSADPIIDWTPFYTSGLSDPQVNDTLYSDSSCTTPITTIQSIA